MTISAPGRMRSPKTFFARTAKSGNLTGRSFPRAAGMIRAMTLLRSRSSTVFPPVTLLGFNVTEEADGRTGPGATGSVIVCPLLTCTAAHVLPGATSKKMLHHLLLEDRSTARPRFGFLQSGHETRGFHRRTPGKISVLGPQLRAFLLSPSRKWNVYVCDFMAADSRLSPRWNHTLMELSNFDDYE